MRNGCRLDSRADIQIDGMYCLDNSFRLPHKQQEL